LTLPLFLLLENETFGSVELRLHLRHLLLRVLARRHGFSSHEIPVLDDRRASHIAKSVTRDKGR
jgi:hypothetical protein